MDEVDRNESAVLLLLELLMIDGIILYREFVRKRVTEVRKRLKVFNLQMERKARTI